MEWTDSQLEAVSVRGRRVLVSAGAGSGKTRVLVERFLKLLEENADWRVSDIVAVTFTEKAAREMVSRIRREIRSRIDTSESLEARRRWREHRNALDSARIGTIHSLCSAILRAHPAEAGLDPAFEIVDEIEGAALVDQAIQDAIEEAASAQADSKSLVEIFAFLSPRDVQSALKSLIYDGERARHAFDRIGDYGAKEIIQFWSAALDESRAERARSIVEQESWESDVRTLRSFMANDPADRREQCRARVVDLLDDIDGSVGVETAALLLELASSINLQGGSKKKWNSEEEFKAVTEALRRLREAVRGARLLALEMNEADAAAAEVAWRLARLYRLARARFAALKQQRQRLDFNDLEEMTDEMLSSHEEVCERYTRPGGLIKALMVDEFQDTSPIQKRILWKIAPRSNELFIIGDAKQSIYRFRGADVTVFHDARDEFRADGRAVGMDACFRTHKRLVDFTNHIFPSVFTVESRYDTAYEAMSASRLPVAEEPSVELHIIVQDKDAESRLVAEELRGLEARLIAERIKEIRGRREVTICGERAGEARPVEYGDFALLFQASTNFEIYEQALASAEVPYVTIAGRGFYNRQEITDLSNLLAFLASPSDSLRLAAALRSPMFALSDETLFRLALRRGTLWESLCDEQVEHAADETDAVAFAREALKRLHSIAGRMSAAEVIVAALAETGYLATLMALPHGERRSANVEKFIEQARALPTITLSDLVERIKDLRFREAREGEATVEEAGAVRLMTVHKSKGLEFPIVWIVDAAYAGGHDRSIVAAHPHLGVAVDVRAEDERGDESVRPASFEVIKLVEDEMDRSEKKRLLYVAATRARDHLIISGSLRGARLGGDHWLGRIASALGIDEEERPGSADYPGGRVRITWHDKQF
ncbi:MAG TPA: UvrD-helicase domain-containing protein [Blastocatellia bacterium]|nr:UvrD-helicase domain-containing protein [Blastocatellia bacterium]